MLVVLVSAFAGYAIVYRARMALAHVRPSTAPLRAGSSVQQYHISRQYALPASIREIDIVIPAGSITITGAPSIHKVAINGVYRASTAKGLSAARQFSNNWHVSADSSKRIMTLAMKQPIDVRFPSPRFDVSIVVPKNVALKIQSANADTTVSDLAGQVQVASTNGSVVVHRVEGAVTLSTVNGNVSDDVASVEGNVSMTSVNGSISFDIKGRPSLKMVAKTMGVVDGNVHWVRRGPHLMSAELGKGRYQATLSTRNGNIDVEASEG